MAARFLVEHSIGDAGAFHAREPGAGRRATFHSVEQPTVVLGSAQEPAVVDRGVAEALGVNVVSRRSGGGAVLLIPGEFVWLDLVVPAGDPLWSDDVAQAMHWVGELWCGALDVLGVQAEVYRGALEAGPWGRQVCFAGLGAGEVTLGGAKLVGVSQRRTRHWARFQSMVHLRFRPELVASLVAVPRPTAADLAARVASVSATAAQIVDALVDGLTVLA